LDAHADYDKAVPTPDHFLPLLYLAGVAGASADEVRVLIDGYAYGSLSMTAYTLGLEAELDTGDAAVGSGEVGATAADLPVGVPPEESNL
jgi:4,5-DOPA dioxygenase extradiol